MADYTLLLKSGCYWLLNHKEQTPLTIQMFDMILFLAIGREVGALPVNRRPVSPDGWVSFSDLTYTRDSHSREARTLSQAKNRTIERLKQTPFTIENNYRGHYRLVGPELAIDVNPDDLEREYEPLLAQLTREYLERKPCDSSAKSVARNSSEEVMLKKPSTAPRPAGESLGLQSENRTGEIT